MHSTEHPVRADEVMALIDGELSSQRASEVREHLLRCVQCRAVGGDLGQISRDLAGWTIGRAPDTLRVAARERDAPQPAFAWLRLRIPVWTTYSITSAAIAGLLLFVASGSRVWREARGAPRTSAAAPRPPTPAGSLEDAGAAPPAAAPGSAAPVFLGGVERKESPPRHSASVARIVRTCSLALTTPDFESVRPALDRILAGAGGFVGRIDVSGAAPDARRLSAELRVPADRLNAVVSDLRTLGTVTAETQSADDVSDQLMDLEARIANGRNTEKRLADLLQRRTGSLSDVLQAEREVARVREEIERLDAQRANLDERVTYATIRVQIAEQQKATLDFGPLPLAPRLRNAAIDGVRSAFASFAGAIVLLLAFAPILVLWGAAIGGVMFLVRRVRGRLRPRGGQARA